MPPVLRKHTRRRRARFSVDGISQNARIVIVNAHVVDNLFVSADLRTVSINPTRLRRLALQIIHILFIDTIPVVGGRQNSLWMGLCLPVP